MLKRTNSTKPGRASDIVRKWHMVDVGNKILGREATKIARYLQGTGKSNFVHNLDSGDYVVVLNAKTVKLSGRKEQEKTYQRYSGYPGGLKERTASQIRATKPSEIVRHAVSGMLPKNKLRDRRLARLFIYADDKHPHADKFENKNS